ncbi:arabinose efflux permease family protein [Frankia casuarinae]|uniref:Major facilitator superfamily MFS_1 n=1 Tax=Frankia casuarinae (strain DSM 45818 / CECT 9043 / HFP020203 / CcI3) TaxID=106370 RepID=Q2J5T8_FRACC|nr:major facilitator superfamily MFS_1 [Frankia casuarinae]EYT89609.1 arabinose efflux permease family protein [Frankia casuarinae]
MTGHGAARRDVPEPRVTRPPVEASSASTREVRLDGAPPNSTDHGDAPCPRPETRDRQRWGALITGWLALFVIGTDLFVVSPLLPIWRSRFDVSLRTAGLTVTVFALAYVVAAPAWGRRAVKVSPPAVLVLALSGFAVCNVLTALAPNFWTLLAARVGTGLFISGATATVFTLVASSAPNGRRASWLGIATSGLLSALWAGAPLGGLVARHTSWRAVFVILAAFAVLILVAARRIWPDTQAARAAAAPASRSAAWRARAVAPTACWAAAVYGLYTYLSAGLGDRPGWSTAWLNASLIVYGLCAVAATFLGGRIADRHGAARTTWTALLLLAAADVAFSASLSSAAVTTCLAIALLAFAAYTAFPAKQAQLVSDHPADSAQLMSWNQSAMYLGITLGSLAGGRIADGHFRALPLACAAVAILGATTQVSTVRRRTPAGHAADSDRW